MQDSKSVILHMIETTGPGGAERVFVDIVKRLDREEFVPVVLLAGEGWLCDNIVKTGVEPEIIKNSGAYDWKFIKGVINLIKNKKVDVIHSHLDDTNVYANIIGTLSRKPVVATYHGMIGTWHIKNFKDSIKLAIVRHHAKYIVAVSDFLKAELVKAGGFKDNQMRRIYNGVDFDALEEKKEGSSLRTEFDLHDKSVLIGTIGNMEVWKGFDYLIKAAPLIIEKVPNAYFFIVGEGKGKILNSIRALISSLNLQDRVLLTGFREDISSIIRQLEVFVLPSISEGLSIATIEAMALGKPVVVTDSGGPKEIVDNEMTGLIVPPKDSKAISEGVIRLLSDKTYAVKLGINGKIAVRNKFGIDENINRYADLYRSCLHH